MAENDKSRKDGESESLSRAISAIMHYSCTITDLFSLLPIAIIYTPASTHASSLA